jgi:hypothetical protein
MAIEVGQQYETTATVTDRTGVLVTPSAIHLNVTLPDGTVINLDGSIVNDSTGVYHADYTMTMEGLHTFVWTTTGPVTHKTDYQNANVFRSVVGIDEARDYVGYTEGDRDDIFRMVMAAATELAEGIVGACVRRTVTNERVMGETLQIIKVSYAPLPTDTSVQSVVSVWSGGPSWVTSDLIVYPDSGTMELAGMYDFWRGPWKVTYTAGRLVISNSIQMAVKEIIYDMWSTQRPYGPGDYEPGPEDTARFEQMLANYSIPPHAQMLLDSEAMPGFA